jgi:AAA15 family ATPase/GTPase
VLIRFGFSNALSVRDYQELSFVASSIKDEGVDLISTKVLKERLLPSLLIYGSNASGKTNVISNIRFLRNAIVTSFKNENPSDRVPVKTFALDQKFAKKPSQFDCDFLLNDIRYHYGFIVNDGRYEKEWLYAFPKGNRQQWFTRDETQKKPYKFGKYLKGRNQFVAEITRPNSLFLSAAAQSGHEQLLELQKFFEIKMGTPSSASYDLKGRGGWRELDRRTISFLQSADTGIETFKIEEITLEERSIEFAKKLKNLMSQEFPDANFENIDSENTRKQLSFGHQTSSGTPIFLDLDDESKGTLQLLELLGPIFAAIDKGGLIIVDEIDTSLHTLLTDSVLKIFAQKKINAKGAQLLATTHDTSLLRSRNVRRDQIWFSQKDASGATSIYPLTDIKTRNTDNIERGYLEGRFGAIPFIS